MNPTSRTAAIVVIALMAVTGCTRLFGDENSTVSPFDVVIKNNSAETIYRVIGQQVDDEVTGQLTGIPPGSSVTAGMGPALDRGPGGCFKFEQMWVVRRNRGGVFPAGSRAADFRDELEIIHHFPPDTCTDSDEIIFEYP